MSEAQLAKREWQIVIDADELIRKLERLEILYFTIQPERYELSMLYGQKKDTLKEGILDLENDIKIKKWEIEKKEKPLSTLKNSINDLVHSIDRNARKHIVNKTEEDIIICYKGKYSSTKRHCPIHGDDSFHVLDGVDIPSTTKITRSLREVLL